MHAKQNAVANTGHWGSLSFQTIKAILRRDGRFVDRNGLDHDFNAQLGALLLAQFRQPWSAYFSQIVPVEIRDFVQKDRDMLTKFITTFIERNRGYSTSNEHLEIIARQLPNFVGLLTNAAREIRLDINHRQRQLNRVMIQDPIQNVMQPAYVSCASIGGKGARDTMVDVLKNHARAHGSRYDDCEARINGDLLTMLNSDVKPKIEAMNKNIEVIINICNNLAFGPGQDVDAQLLKPEGRELKEQIAKKLEGLNEALRAASSAEVYDPLFVEQ